MRHSFANGLVRKHAVKQVDRWLTHTKLNVWSLFDDRVPYVVAERIEIVVSMDWTEFDTDDHSTQMLACNRVDLDAAKALRLYGQCWGIETRFRDIKDEKFGMEMGSVRISNAARRDRRFCSVRWR